MIADRTKIKKRKPKVLNQFLRNETVETAKAYALLILSQRIRGKLNDWKHNPAFYKK